MSTCETAALLSVYFERIVICGFDIMGITVRRF